jgi:leader peptidase (prepilin peptidase) / N-methyltransferase
MNVEHLRIIFSVIFGLLMGSFGNVCIARLPTKKSIVKPRSHCPKCNALIVWYDNIPIISYLLLGGRCRNCRKNISASYPIIESISAILGVVCYYKFGWDFESLFYFIFLWGLLVIIVIDLRHMIIPNVLTFSGIILGLIGAASKILPISFTQSLIGLLVGGGILWLSGYGYYMFTKRMGLGGGDIKLMAAIGAFLGLDLMILTLFVSSFLGAIVGIYLILVRKKSSKYAIPFGPYIAGGAAIALFFGYDLMRMYGGIGFLP